MYRPRYEQTKRISDLESRTTTLESKYFRLVYFEDIGKAPSGQITPPTGATILLNGWADGADALVAALSGTDITSTSPKTAGGTIISVSSFDADGNYTLSGTPDAGGPDVALIYYYRVQLIDFDDTATIIQNSLEPFDRDNVDITGGIINDTTVGGTTPAAGTFTGLVATTITKGSIEISSTSDGAEGSTLIGYKDGETVKEILDDIIYPTILDAISVSDLGGLNISWGAGKIYDPNGNIVAITSGSGTCTDNTENYLYWTTGTGLTLSTGKPDSGDVPVAHIHTQAGDIWELHEEPVASTLTRDMQHGLAELFPVAVATGCLVAEDSDVTNDLDVEVSAGRYYHDAHSEHIVANIKSRTTPMRRWYHSSSVWTSGTDAEIDTAQYDNGANLANYIPNRWGRGLFLVSTTTIHFIYPQAQYVTKAQAVAAVDPAIPPGLSDFPRSSAVVFQQGDTDFSQAVFIDVRPMLGTIASGSTVSDHGSLGGLSDVVDHPGYLLVDGSRALAGAWDMGSQALTNLDMDSGTIDTTNVTIGAGTPIASIAVDSLTLDGTTLSSSGKLTLAGGEAADQDVEIASSTRLRIVDDASDPAVPTSGSGLEIFYLGDGNAAHIAALDRPYADVNSWKPFFITGYTLIFRAHSTAADEVLFDDCNVTMDENLVVTGNLNAGTLDAGNTDVSGTFEVTGIADFKAAVSFDKTITCDVNVDVAGDIDADGHIQCGAADVFNSGAGNAGATASGSGSDLQTLEVEDGIVITCTFKK